MQYVINALIADQKCDDAQTKKKDNNKAFFTITDKLNFKMTKSRHYSEDRQYNSFKKRIYIHLFKIQNFTKLTTLFIDTHI